MKRHRIRLGINPAVWLPFGVGLIAAAATFLLLGQIRSATHPARTTWFVIAIALLVVGSITTVLGIAAASQQWHESRATPLELAHDSCDIHCVQRRASDLELRIKVRNTGQFDPHDQESLPSSVATTVSTVLIADATAASIVARPASGSSDHTKIEVPDVIPPRIS